jgi:hypothetical protein
MYLNWFSNPQPNSIHRKKILFYLSLTNVIFIWLIIFWVFVLHE